MHDTADATMTGQWLWLRRWRGPKNAVTAAAKRGKPGMNTRKEPGSDMARLLGLRRLDARGGQPRQRCFRRRRRQRPFFLVRCRLQARLAEILPEADVERTAAAVKHEPKR